MSKYLQTSLAAMTHLAEGLCIIKIAKAVPLHAMKALGGEEE
jgi:hypothetical protein